MKLRRAVPLVLCALVFACRPGEPPVGAPPTPTPGLPRSEPTVRIGIVVDSTSTVVGATTGFAVRGVGGGEIARGNAGETWTFAADDEGRLTARGPAGRSFIDPRGGPMRVIPDRDGGLTISGRPYRGEALIIPRSGGRLSTINVVDLEAYLLGVVPHEIGRLPANMIEATKAQAVAARTYAIGNLGGRDRLGFDFYATVMDQVYGGMTQEDTIVSRAVRETRGEIITHNGTPILAYYASTCGGTTAAIEDSWPWRSPLPYLKSVSDRIPGSDEYYCGTSNRFTWTTRWTRPQLLAVLGETLRGSVTAGSRINDVRVIERNASQRATVRLTVDNREHILRADSIRWVMRPQPGPAILNSSRIDDITVENGANGIESVQVRGGGWGHAIGMCQVGAMGRARAGQRYSEILRAYYTGVELQRLY